jgi:hypothetical protein
MHGPRVLMLLRSGPEADESKKGTVKEGAKASIFFFFISSIFEDSSVMVVARHSRWPPPAFLRSFFSIRDGLAKGIFFIDMHSDCGQLKRTARPSEYLSSRIFCH